MRRVATATLVALLAIAAAGKAETAQERATFYVSPDGNDAAAGSAEAPWRTISHAARSVAPGSAVDIRGGTYNERVVVEVSGEPGNPITFFAHPGEAVTISGAGLKGRGGEAVGLIDIVNKSNLEFIGIELRDLQDRKRRFTPAGVWIRGTSSNITLRGLDVHDIRTRGGDAHGIAVYGTSGRAPISGVSIESNSVHDLKLGSSEAIAVNGNVDGWSIVGNSVFNVDNIGIDAIGYEGTARRNDRARNGVIAQNNVSDVDTLGNPAYRTGGQICRCAGGIYVDGGQGIVIERNRVTRSNLGIELASEHRTGATSDVLVRNNLIVESDRAGLIMGGYDTRRGKTERVQVVNNTILDSDQLGDGIGAVELSYRLIDVLVVNNVFRATDAGLMVTNWFKRPSGVSFEGNVWFAPDRSTEQTIWVWRTKRLRGFEAWRSTTGLDATSRYADPLLDAGVPQPGSAAIDAGVASDLPGEVDLAGSPRVAGGGLDAGAFEAG